MRFSTSSTSISAWISANTSSRRLLASAISSSRWRSSSFRFRCVATVSASREAELIWATVLRISGGTFLFSLT